VDDREPTIEIDMSGIGEADTAPATNRIGLVLSDVHTPSHDKRCVAAVCEYAADLRPHILVLNGDILDFEEISKYSQGNVALLEGKRIGASWKAANEFLDQVIGACGDRLSEIHWVSGNHENRLTRWLNSGSNAVFADDFGLSIPDRLQFKRRGIIDHGDWPDAHVRLGHLLVTHGRFTGKYAAARHLEYYRHSLLVGHTHQPQVFYASGFVKQAAFVQGHLADNDAQALSYVPKINGWCHGFSVVHVKPDGTFQVQLVNFHDHQFHIGDKTYGGGA
jgi:predicted phosphodiesterase